MAAPRILTTVVGSYPVPDWLARSPTRQALVDATRVVLRIQEEAGIDLVADGEIGRFDPDHPETNGMIEYFLHPMAGIRREVEFEELMAFRRDGAMAFRLRPPGVVEGRLGPGSLDLPGACGIGRGLARGPFKFTLTGPHMLAKTLLDRHYADTPALCRAIADVLAGQVAHLEADVVQIDPLRAPLPLRSL